MRLIKDKRYMCVSCTYLYFSYIPTIVTYFIANADIVCNFMINKTSCF